MSEATARALKAPSPMLVKFGDKECQVRPLGIQELTEAERECIKNYKRSYLETYSENVDLLPNGQVILLEKMEIAARWDIDDLPPKSAYDTANIKVTDKLKAYVAEHFELSQKDLTNDRTKRLSAALLDEETLSVKAYTELTRKSIKAVKIPYVSWWVTGSFDGRVTLVWLCFKKYGVSKEEVLDKFTKDSTLLVELSREIERLSTPEAGNG